LEEKIGANSISKDQANYSLTPIKWVQTIHEVEFGFL
jgi:hypothetical protein